MTRIKCASRHEAIATNIGNQRQDRLQLSRKKLSATLIWDCQKRSFLLHATA